MGRSRRRGVEVGVERLTMDASESPSSCVSASLSACAQVSQSRDTGRKLTSSSAPKLTLERTLARVRTLAPLDALALALRCGSNAAGRRSVGGPAGLTAYDLDRVESLPRIMRRAS